MHVVLIGFTSCGKSTVGARLAAALGMSFEDLDVLITEHHNAVSGEHLSCRQIFRRHGAEIFRTREHDALAAFAPAAPTVLATGGGAPLRPDNRPPLLRLGFIAYLRAQPATLWERMTRKGPPSYLGPDPTIDDLARVWAERDPIYEELASCIVDVDHNDIQRVVDALAAAVGSD
jgi:shikimate kinase